MSELRDYSGEVNPNLKWEHFSKELLLEALRAYAQYNRKVDALWYLAVKERLGAEEASILNTQVIENSSTYQIEIIRKVFKIQENDVAGFVKFLQTWPWSWIVTKKFEFKSSNHVIYTITHCPILEGMEKDGEGREQYVCHEDHVRGVRRQASLFNPKIKVEPLKLPPRNSKNEIACQWELRLEAGT